MYCDQVARLLKDKPGLSDREMADLLLGPGTAEQPVMGFADRMASGKLRGGCRNSRSPKPNRRARGPAKPEAE